MPYDPRTLSPAARDNHDWLEQLRRSDEAALHDLHGALRRGLGKALATHRKVGEADLEDFAQDGLMRVLDRLDSFRGDSKFTTWAHSVAINNALTELRRRRWQDVALDELDTLAPTSSGETGHDLEHAEVLQVLQQALQSALTDKQRRAMLLLLEGLPYPAVADRMGMQLNAVYKLSHDARMRLREAFHESGFEDADIRSHLDATS